MKSCLRPGAQFDQRARTCTAGGEAFDGYSFSGAVMPERCYSCTGMFMAVPGCYNYTGVLWLYRDVIAIPGCYGCTGML